MRTGVSVRQRYLSPRRCHCRLVTRIDAVLVDGIPSALVVHSPPGALPGIFFFFLHSLRRLKAPQIKPETQALFVLADSLTRRSTWVVSGGSYDTLFIQLQKAEAGDESTRVSEDINLRTPHRRACFAPHIQAVACEIFPLRGF